MWELKCANGGLDSYFFFLTCPERLLVYLNSVMKQWTFSDKMNNIFQLSGNIKTVFTVGMKGLHLKL